MGMLRWQDHELTGSANLSPTNFCPVDTVAGSLCVSYGNKAMRGVKIKTRCGTLTFCVRSFACDDMVLSPFPAVFLPCWGHATKLASGPMVVAAPSCWRMALALVIACRLTTPLMGAEPPPQASASPATADLQQLIERNRQLEERLNRQQALIESLSSRVDELTKASVEREKSAAEGSEPASKSPLSRLGSQVQVHGDAGLGFFKSSSQGTFPQSAFRIDQARLFVEAPIWNKTFLWAGLDVVTRESGDDRVGVGELYVDVEDLSDWWGEEGQMTLRIGRFQAPFGEEYARRYVMENPLISTSLTDYWSLDEGLELFGRVGRWDYAVAVQNGGIPALLDSSSDKAVIAKVGYAPTSWMRLSASAMRTGSIQVRRDTYSSLWFGNAFFRSIGSAGTSEFDVNLVQLNQRFEWRGGHVALSEGAAFYDDNDPIRDNHREFYHVAVEGVQQVTRKVFGAARFSQVFVEKGYPVAGNGDPGRFFYNADAPFVTDIWRLSLGAGYRFSPAMVLKAEYAWERAQNVQGPTRSLEEFYGIELGVRF